MTDNGNWETVIGLEVHAQLSTETKIFCGCKTKFGAPPNSQVCPVCLGMPGVLPVFNQECLNYAIKVGLAMNCNIASNSRFARKNYFYPDLPKGYQISQFEEPICEGGKISVETDDGAKTIGITRIHLEEDAGKSLHDKSKSDTKVDLNRCGVPLIEIVSEPDIRSPEDAYKYLVKLKQILRYLDVSDCNMEEGSLRCDANVSIMKKGSKEFGTKTELKNMNSFRGVEKALNAEIKRQIALVESGGEVIQSTNLWNEKTGEIVPMRSKEQSDDYRYFPEPDLVPFTIEENYIGNIRNELPELPEERNKRFMNDFGLSATHAGALTASRRTADYYEELAELSNDPKNAASWVMGHVNRVLNEQEIEIEEFSITPKRLVQLMDKVSTGAVSISAARIVFDEMVSDSSEVDSLIERLGVEQVSDDSEIDKIVQGIIDSNPDESERYKNGETKLKGWFVGQVMKSSKGKANPQMVNEALDRLLEIES
ncbi:MAG: Asp-tRNA(Asn)/Glu-tRNA(Gln) amidotransferase subunit GatB [Candidatus Marinimicrobia bacterium]|nr:Asp-tRNA(Asn)/Glu-tRNA(Gln) amidotransferase subunit GatB [Candidatus Neomarinimicrobiota bacterium]